jgi:hypothetical protein
MQSASMTKYCRLAALPDFPEIRQAAAGFSSQQKSSR